MRASADHRLDTDVALRRICGWERKSEMPSDAEEAAEALISAGGPPLPRSAIEARRPAKRPLLQAQRGRSKSGRPLADEEAKTVLLGRASPFRSVAS